MQARDVEKGVRGIRKSEPAEPPEVPGVKPGVKVTEMAGGGVLWAPQAERIARAAITISAAS